MFPTLLSLWLTLSGKGPRKDRSRQRPASRRPLLNVLEDRAVPAALTYSTYLPGTAYASAVDSAGDIYVTGSGDFVAKLNPTGTTVLYSTTLGSGGTAPAGIGIAVDSAGDAYVIGTSTGVPTTPNAIGSSGSGTDFVAELNPTGSSLLYANYLPDSVNLVPPKTQGYNGAIAVDGSGNIYVAGAAEAGFPVTAGAFQTACLAPTGQSNAFFAKINPALSGSAYLLYATYLGGNDSHYDVRGDAATGIALDSSGNAYLTGYTTSSNFPTTSGAFQTSNGGDEFDSFVAKFNPALSGSASLLYSTYLGGSGGDNGYDSSVSNVGDMNQIDGGIAVDSAGNAYVTSATTSTNFPTTTRAFQVSSGLTSNGGTWILAPCDAFVTKLNPTGTALVYSTYLGSGGSTYSGGAGIALDSNGDAYVTDWTSSTAFPTKNPLQATNKGGYDAFETTLNASGSALLFSTYLGGSSNDDGFGIAVDSAGNSYVAGGTASSNFPTTAGAYQTTAGSGFVSKITPVAVLDSFGVTGFPSSTTAGVAGTITVTPKGANGSVLTGYTGTVHFTSSDPQAGLPANYTFTAADQGVHTFNVTLDSAGTQSITVADEPNGLPGSETGITVNPAAVSTLSIAGYPSPTTIGLPSNFTVTALDPYGNVVTGYTRHGRLQQLRRRRHTARELHLHGGRCRRAYLQRHAEHGRHTVADRHRYDEQHYRIANRHHRQSGRAARGHVYRHRLPHAGDGRRGRNHHRHGPRQPTATSRRATAARSTSAAATHRPCLPANYTFTNADQGVHTFTVTLKTAGSQSITATDTSTGSITGSESGITIKPAAASQFILTAPSSATKGTAFSVTLTVEAAYGNVVTGYTGTVSFTSSDSTAVLPANYTFKASDNGVHTFTNGVTLKKKGTQTLTVTDTQNSALTATDSISVG